MGFFKNWDDWGSLERSLPVVNGEFFQKLGRLGFLRTLATGSELRFQWIFSTILGPLERSLPVVNWDSKGFFKNRGALIERPLPVVIWDLNWFFLQLGWSGALRTLATGSVLRGCDGRSLLERSLYQVASVLRNTDHPNVWKNSPFTIGSECSKEPRSSQFLKNIPIHYR